MLQRRGLQAQPSIPVDHNSSGTLDGPMLATAPAVSLESFGDALRTIGSSTSPHVIPNIDGGGKWTCRFGRVTCGFTFNGDDSTLAVKKHLKEFHGIDTRLTSSTIKCLWSEHGSPGCLADIQAKGLAKHVAHVHLRIGAEKCSYCHKTFSRGDSAKRHYQRCRVLKQKRK